MVIVSRDPDPPYDRTAVSKGFLGGEKSRDGRPARRRELVRRATTSSCSTRTSAMKLDTEAHTVTLANKDVLKYGKLLLATGANVRRLRLDGCDLDGIHYLRALGNADHIRDDTASAQRVVLVGGSYIATEVAATLTALGRQCTLIMQEDVTLERTFGKTAGGFFQKALTDHGVRSTPARTSSASRARAASAAVVTKMRHARPGRRGRRRRRRHARRDAGASRGPGDRRARRRDDGLAPADLRARRLRRRRHRRVRERPPRRRSTSGSSTGTSPRTRARPRR